MLAMRFYKTLILAFLTAGLMLACGGNSEPKKPLDTLREYQNAVRAKDATTMKLLLSEESLKLHQQEAQAQGLTLDDIVLRDTLFPPDQKVFGYRNEKIEGEKASIEVKNNIGSYDTIYLVLEDGVWKIDKKETSNQMIQEVSKPTTDFEDMINNDRQRVEDEMKNAADPTASPGSSPADPAAPNTSPAPDATALPDTSDQGSGGGTGTAAPPPPPPPPPANPNP